MADPVYLEKHRAACRNALMADPEKLAAARERQRRLAEHNRTPEERRKRSAMIDAKALNRRKCELHPAGSPSRRKAGQTLTASRLAWCPPHLRKQYLDLLNRRALPAAEAKRVILDQHETDMERFRRKAAEWAPK